jgi:biotin carboxyl carrier protein
MDNQNNQGNQENLGFLNIQSSLYKTRISSKFQNRKPYTPIDPRRILSFIPGTVLEIFVKKGDIVSKGETLMLLDAMKMQNNLKCNIEGRVKDIPVSKGDRVSKGTLLIELE